VIFGEGLLKFFDLLITETSMERMHSAMLASVSNEMLYDMKSKAGGVRPVVGINQPSEPDGEVPPEEDY
jgi:hypothetical protein